MGEFIAIELYFNRCHVFKIYFAAAVLGHLINQKNLLSSLISKVNKKSLIHFLVEIDVLIPCYMKPMFFILG